MHFQIKMLQNVRKNIFREKKKAGKSPLVFLHVKVLTGRQQLHFWNLLTNKQGSGYVFSF